MQVHLVNRHLVYRGLGLGQTPKERLGTLTRTCRQGTSIDEDTDFLEAPVPVPLRVAMLRLFRLLVFVVRLVLVMRVVMMLMRRLVPVALGVLVRRRRGTWRLVHVELRRRDPAAQDRPGGHVRHVAPETAQRRDELVERQPSIETGAQDHVTRDAGETVQVQHARHQSCPISFRLQYPASPSTM